MAERNNQDTRRYRRQTLRVLVDYLTEAGICCDYATTLGAGGMFLETDEPLTVGMTIKARFRLPRGEELHEVEGKVVWRRESTKSGEPTSAGGVGVKFTGQIAIAKLARELEDYEL
jgi:Tfp pilus assembly protein PilZ